MGLKKINFIGVGRERSDWTTEVSGLGINYNFLASEVRPYITSMYPDFFIDSEDENGNMIGRITVAGRTIGRFEVCDA